MDHLVIDPFRVPTPSARPPTGAPASFLMRPLLHVSASPRFPAHLQSPSPRFSTSTNHPLEPVTPDRNVPAVPFCSPDDATGLTLPGLTKECDPVPTSTSTEMNVVNEKEADAVFEVARLRTRSTDPLFGGLRSPIDLPAGSFPGSSNLPTPNLSQSRINQLQQRPAGTANSVPSPLPLFPSAISPRMFVLPTPSLPIPTVSDSRPLYSLSFASSAASAPVTSCAPTTTPYLINPDPMLNNTSAPVATSTNNATTSAPLASLSMPSMQPVLSTALSNAQLTTTSSSVVPPTLNVNATNVASFNYATAPAISTSSNDESDSSSSRKVGPRLKPSSSAISKSLQPPPTCEICNNQFARRSNLYKHLRSVHSTKRQFKCPICDYGFKRQDHLLKHQRSVHSKERPFVCDLCGTAFAEKYNKQKHLRVIHETKRPFRCNCGAYFQQRDQMLACLRCKRIRANGGL